MGVEVSDPSCRLVLKRDLGFLWDKSQIQ